jgi:hypothetical protein
MVAADTDETAASTAKTPPTDMHVPARNRAIVSTLFVVDARSRHALAFNANPQLPSIGARSID